MGSQDGNDWKKAVIASAYFPFDSLNEPPSEETDVLQ